MAKSKIIAAIDIGSNSIVLLVARCHANGLVEPINEVFAITKLGRELSKTELLADDAMRNTIAAAKEMRMIADHDGAEDIVVVATHAVRAANNRSEFLVNCHREIGVFPQVLSGKEEAKFTYLGASSDISENKDILTIDVGGGSTEIAFGTRQVMIDAHSLPIGCVSLCDQFKIGKGEWITDRIAAKNHIRKMLFGVVDPVNTWLKGKTPEVVASGGTANTYTAILAGKHLYDRTQSHMKKSSRKELAVINRKLSRMSLDARIRVPGMEKDRADVLPAGLMILSEVLEFFSFNAFSISANGLRFGILRHYIQRNF
jgi:exopolyphosphatase/guanosine-5'-triphosphate,3'-diphosphate pyrophosphatase